MKTLDDNMRLGIDVAAEVRRLVPESSNYMSTSSPISTPFEGGIYDPGPKPVRDLRATLDEIKEQVKKEWFLTEKRKTLASVKRRHDAIVAAKVGNCAELSIVAAHMLHSKRRTCDAITVRSRKDRLPPAHKSSIPHVFVVIGRVNNGEGINAEVGLPDTWGATAVVVDPWDRVAYPAAQFANFWGALRTAANGNTLYCQLELRL